MSITTALSQPLAFHEDTEAAICDIELRSEILAKMSKTKLYKNQSPERVMRNAFNTVFKLLLLECKDQDSIDIADQQKEQFEEALEKLNLLKD